MRSPNQRRLEHMHNLRHKKHCSPYLQHCFNKHGEDSLLFEVIEAVDDANFILAREQFHIWRNHQRLLNSHPVADSTYAAMASNIGRVQSKEERAMRSRAIKKAIDDGITQYRPWTKERRKSHGEALKGRIMPKAKPERGLKISKALKGRACPPKAIACSVATRTAFIANEVHEWLAMRESGLSFREIERITGRCRRVIGRECKKVIDNVADKGASEPTSR